MYTPTLAKAKALAGSARFVPMYREILADLETPVSAYLKYAAGRDSFLLESVEGIEHVGRYSFIGARPREVLDIREGGKATLETPDGQRQLEYDDPLELVDSLLVFDHSRRTIKAVTRLPLDGDLEANYREAAERIELMIDRLDQP